MPNTQLGSYVPTTNVWDVQNIKSLEVNSDEFKELIIRLYQNINDIALNLNIKDTGYYDRNEFVCGQLYYPNPSLSPSSPLSQQYRNVYRKTFDFGALPNATTKTVDHGITLTPGTTFTRVIASSSDPVGQIYFSFTYNPGGDASVSVNGPDIEVVTTTNLSAFTTTYVVLEYLQQ